MKPLRFRLSLLARATLALAAVGLLPLALSYFGLVGVNREAIFDQVLQTHSLAARTAASRVAAFLDVRLALAHGAAGSRVLADPRSPEAQEFLVQSLQGWAGLGVEGLAVVNARGEEVMRVQLRSEASRQRAAKGFAGGWSQEVEAVPGTQPPLLRIAAPLPQGAGALRLVCDGSPLAELLRPEELGGQAELALADRGGRRLLGGSLEAFPAVLLRQALSGRVGGAGRYQGRDGTEILGAFAPVPSAPWVVVSRQPARVAEAVAVRLRQRSALALGAALLLIAGLSAGAWIAVVRPIRDLARAQRELAKTTVVPAGSNEIEDLQKSFEAMRRGIFEREALNDVFLGRYQVVEFVAAGGMGSVFRGWDPKLQRPVALKTVRLGTDLVPEKRRHLISQLIREAVTAARFSHTNVVTVYDVEDAPDGAFVAMEYVDGISLEQLLLRRGRLTPAEVVPLGAGIARGLAVAHARDVVHRDVKPANVLLGRDGTIKVSDFGISELVSTASRADGLVFGTPGYLPPESLRGEGHTRAGDLFALGVILYESLTSVRPFGGGLEVREVVQSTLFGDLKPPSEKAPGIPPDLDSLVLLLLDRDPKRRPKDAAGVAAELERIAAAHGFVWEFGDAAPVRLEPVPALPSPTIQAQWVQTRQV